MYEFRRWVVGLLNEKNAIFKNWEETSVQPDDIWSNFKFHNWRGKVNGRIKAFYDGCKLSPEGLKLGNYEPVKMRFRGYAIINFKNGTSMNVWTDVPWGLPGYSSDIECYLGQLTIEAIKWFGEPNIDEKTKTNLANWLLPNILSVFGGM